jgi:hypothetical protein
MNQRGITYIESIAGLAMLGLLILAASSMTAIHPVASARLAAQHEMLAALDTTLERVRAGTVPLAAGEITWDGPGHAGIRLFLEVQETDRPGLTSVRVVARTSVRGRALERSLSTAVWRPS